MGVLPLLSLQVYDIHNLCPVYIHMKSCTNLIFFRVGIFVHAKYPQPLVNGSLTS